ncbi:MbtH family protein [Amycolatopsis plumensis]|uniref:MbtH family protein n=1 Tax=Amycolatopsis plumensis TaxID=236508 RepID=A0ABV5UDM0_9PSEU
MNCFDDPDGAFLVLVNDEKRYSLWPDTLDVPAGWRVAEGPDSRDRCFAFIEANCAGDLAEPAAAGGDR